MKVNSDYFLERPITNKPIYTVSIQDNGKEKRVYMNEDQLKRYDELQKLEEENLKKQRDFIKQQEWQAFINKVGIYTTTKDRENKNV